MYRVIIAFVAGVAAGIAMAFAPVGPERTERSDGSAKRPIAAVECRCDVQPGSDVERALDDERSQNARLRAEVERLRNALERATTATSSPAADAVNWLEAARADLMVDDESPDQRQAMIDAGFAPARADWIADRLAALQMDALQQRLRDPDATGPTDYLDSRLASRRALREEIGDFEYEQYLSATGQSTTIAVTGVLPDSPAQQAGLEVGDEIVDYGGVRVFNMVELADRAQSADPQRPVVVNIMRDGAPMQMVLPGGALGVTGGRPMQR